MAKKFNGIKKKSTKALLIKRSIEEYYLIAMSDISSGASIQELEDTMEEYEQEEHYEACAGILKAIHESGYLTIKDIINKIDNE